jgi:ABC-type bacteriocin/lantibiotic exporter with double-glycine peptidase domain
MEITDCGAACLAMVLAYHGKHVPLPELREQCGIGRDGADAYTLARVAQQHGLNVEASRLELEHLPTLPTPAILHWEFNHFVVLARYGRTSALVIDPELGRRRLTHADISRSFTGVALAFRKDTSFQARARRRPSVDRYMAMIKRAWPQLAMVLGASFFLDLVGFVFPAGTQVVIDLVVVPRQERWLWALAAVVVLGTLARSLLLLVRTWTIQGLQFYLDRELMGGFVSHLLQLPIAFFHKRMPGDLVRRVQDNAAVRDLFTSRSVTLLLDCSLLVGYCALMMAYEARLGSVVLGFGMLRAVVLVAMRDLVEHAAAVELQAAGRESATLVETLAVPEVIKAFGTEERALSRHAERLVVRLNAGLARRRLTMGLGYLMFVLDGMTKAAVILLGGTLVLNDEMTVGVLSAFMTLQMLVISPLEAIIGAFNELQMFRRQFQRLDDVMAAPEEPTGASTPGVLRGAIRLDNVFFRYGPHEPPVIQDVSLEVKPGERIALVGRSGAGKSTLGRLMLGLVAPDAGAVYVDGRNLRELNLREVRQQFGVVSQTAFLFNDTIRHNLALGYDVSGTELRVAAATACIDDVIDALPGKYDATLQRGGTRLSGGQRQRIAIARAIARAPAVLLLDEATSSLDLETEARVQARLSTLRCTQVIIAHRLATIRDADRIVVLDAGRVVEVGGYEELLQRHGLFHELVRALPSGQAMPGAVHATC